jgi:hypothetical protein
VAIAIDRRGAATFRRIDQALHHVEAYRALGGTRARRDIDRDDTGGFEHGSRQHCEIAKAPRRERVIGAQREQRIAGGRNVRRGNERDGHGDRHQIDDVMP